MPVNKVLKAVSAANDEIFASYAPILERSDAVASYVAEQLKKWQFSTVANLGADFPFAEVEKKLTTWDAVISAQDVSRENLSAAIEDYFSLCKATGRPANESFWKNQLETNQSDNQTDVDIQADLSVIAHLLHAEWQKTMDMVRGEWELEQLSRLRAQLMAQLTASLEVIQQLHDQLETLGLEPGLLFDLSNGSLSAQDIEQFKRWAEYLAEDEGVRSLCDLLGKIRQIEHSEKIERVQINHAVNVELPDINSREEIIGIRLGSDLEYALPSELALLSDPETSLLFDLKLVESRLMCFDMQGIQLQQEDDEIEEDRQVHEDEKQGPMVICIDTSGSMSGTPETIAKAVALFMSAQAKRQSRHCYLINFSTTIETLDLTGDFGMASLIDFLKMSFHGGTDVAPAIEHALEVMEQDAYEKADLLVISDFIMAGLPDDMLEQIENQRSNGNRFYSLVIGHEYMSRRLKSLFDQEWIYDPASSSIHELIGFQQRMSDKTMSRTNSILS